MTHEHDDRGRLLRSWDDDGRLVYAARANWGLEAERTMAHIPHRFGLFYRAGLLAEVERRGVET